MEYNTSPDEIIDQLSPQMKKLREVTLDTLGGQAQQDIKKGKLWLIYALNN